MIVFLRSLFESALKTNPHLEFAVITGCLRISRESIFTGLNNLTIYSVQSTRYADDFGFTKQETEKILTYSIRGGAVILELKTAERFDQMEGKCMEALKQIEKEQYEAALRSEGYQQIHKYGVCFFQKECMVRCTPVLDKDSST